MSQPSVPLTLVGMGDLRRREQWRIPSPARSFPPIPFEPTDVGGTESWLIVRICERRWWRYVFGADVFAR